MAEFRRARRQGFSRHRWNGRPPSTCFVDLLPFVTFNSDKKRGGFFFPCRTPVTGLFRMHWR
jgi:hypothetical protein